MIVIIMMIPDDALPVVGEEIASNFNTSI